MTNPASKPFAEFIDGASVVSAVDEVGISDDEWKAAIVTRFPENILSLLDEMVLRIYEPIPQDNRWIGRGRLVLKDVANPKNLRLACTSFMSFKEDEASKTNAQRVFEIIARYRMGRFLMENL